MGERLPSFLPRLAVVVLVVLATTAGLTFAAGQQIASTPAPAAAAAAKPAPKTLVVPDLRNQAFVFAKGQLQDLGFAWRVTGGVLGYASNTVVSQSPAPGTKLLDTGAPLVVVTLARNRAYPQTGEPANASPYAATRLRLADAAVAAAPALPRAAAAPTRAKAAPARATGPKRRPSDFVVPGARREPADELPLPVRAAALGTWLAAHPTQTPANVRHWLYQNEWIVAGARMGWWHGAQALRTLVAVDRRTTRLWGIGGKSAALARRALAEVEARSS